MTIRTSIFIHRRNSVKDDDVTFKESEHPRVHGSGEHAGEFTASGGGSGGGITSNGPTKKVGPIIQADLSDTDKAALHEYQYGDFANLNAGLRKGEAPGQLAKDLDAAIKKGNLEKQTTVYRGLAGEKPFNFKVGETLTDKGYMSTSLSEEVSEDFSVGVGHPQTATIKLSLPKGQNAAFFEEFGGYTHKEVLLPRNTEYKIMRVTPQGNGHVVVEAQVASKEEGTVNTVVTKEAPRTEPQKKPTIVTQKKPSEPELTESQIARQYGYLWRGGGPASEVKAATKAVKQLAKKLEISEGVLTRRIISMSTHDSKVHFVIHFG